MKASYGWLHAFLMFENKENEKIFISNDAARMLSDITCAARSDPVSWYSGGRKEIGDDTKIERERIYE